jgi:hypothetical protein
MTMTTPCRTLDGGRRTARRHALGTAFVAAILAGCAPPEEPGLHGVIGPEGGALVGAPGTPFQGVRLQLPPGALEGPTYISITEASETSPLPRAAVRCGPMFAIRPAGLALKVPATATLPYDPNTVEEHFRFDDEVKVWAAQGTGWGQRLQTDNASGTVTIELEALTTIAAGVNPPEETEKVRFSLRPNPKFVKCLARNDREQPEVDVTVVKGEQNDGLFLRGRNIRPGVEFDLFTVERSALLADGTADPTFDSNFGLAFYQSDVLSSDRGRVRVNLRSIFLNVLFGFDGTSTLAPRGIHQVGFWFDEPEEAAACGFDVTKPTPFNPKHQAGPLAMISVPDAQTGLGPLCIDPDTSVNPAVCSTDED